MRNNQERMEAKIRSEIKTIQEKMESGQEMKAQVGSLTTQINDSRDGYLASMAKR
jgi:hypothetical protein